MILIFVPHITNRVQYIFHYVFEERLGCAFRLTDDVSGFINSDNVFKINYSKENFQTGLFFYAVDLLFENDINEINPEPGSIGEVKIIFSHQHPSALCFDVYAATFYLLSRYEEYLDKPTIQHGNYDYKNSVLHALNILDVPVVEQWIEILKKILIENLPSLHFKKHSPKVGYSFDVDVAYAYKGKSFVRTAGGIAKKTLQLNFTEAYNQLATYFGRRNDMYDTYSYVFSLLKENKPVYFFNMGNHGEFDKNPSWKNKNFKHLIQYVAQHAEIGLHPSYSSNIQLEFVEAEKKRIEAITGLNITRSRQHYLKLKWPVTYNNLIQNKIGEDYTIGYYYTYGFRAGTCNSFLFFDLLKNDTTSLRLFPYSYMDGTLNDILKMSIEQAKAVISKLVDVTYKYDGIFIPLWHNSTLYNRNEWTGWREVFEHTIYEIRKRDFENLFD
ncbi:MAG: hypothetical protein JST21_06220 [Bacteroidetes bacterium]|nr:hypothetical protein [Bacteroidota bacterium]